MNDDYVVDIIMMADRLGQVRTHQVVDTIKDVRKGDELLANYNYRLDEIDLPWYTELYNRKQQERRRDNRQ